MKIGIFTDSHYSSQEITCGNRYNSQSLRKIEEALHFFLENGCELVLCLGDLIDHEGDHKKEIDNLRQAAMVFHHFSDSKNMRILCMMGNHDAFTFTKEEFYEILGEEFRPETMVISETDDVSSSKTLFFPDTCYFADGRHYAPGDTDWTDTFLPEAENLRRELSELPEEAVIFLHQNIDPTIQKDHCLANAAEIRRILEESEKVRTVYQGHFHPGNETEWNGIRYVTFPAMCELEEAWFVVEI